MMTFLRLCLVKELSSFENKKLGQNLCGNKTGFARLGHIYRIR